MLIYIVKDKSLEWWIIKHKKNIKFKKNQWKLFINVYLIVLLKDTIWLISLNWKIKKFIGKY